MNSIELADACERVGENRRSSVAYDRAREAAACAPGFWCQDIIAGHLSEADISVAQAAAMELSLIVDGALFLLGRAPSGPRFGVLTRTERSRAGFRRGSRRQEPDAVEFFRHRQRARVQTRHPPAVRLHPIIP